MSTINQLNAATTISPGDLLPVYISNNGDARKVAMSLLATWIASQITTSDNKVTQYSAPAATGFNTLVADSSNSVWLILTPTAGFAAGTIALPTLANCVNKQEVLVNSTQSITALTVAGNGATVTGAPTTMPANGFFRMRFDSVMSTWYRVG